MKVVRLATGVVLWLLVLGLGSLAASGVSGGLANDSDWLSVGTTIQVTILVASVVLILALSRGRAARYGLRLPTVGHVKAALVYGSVAALAVHALLGGLWKLLPPPTDHPVTTGASLLEVAVLVWVFASISEETLHRGLVQSFLEPLRQHGVRLFRFRLSLPVLAAALLFGLMHTMLLTTGADRLFVGSVVGSAVVLGVVAGHYREKSGSVVPAILVHFLFNAYGGAAQYVRQLVGT